MEFGVAGQPLVPFGSARRCRLQVDPAQSTANLPLSTFNWERRILGNRPGAPATVRVIPSGSDSKLDAPPPFHYAPAMSKAPKTPANPADELPFEEAMQKLEAIVEAMESGDLPLETMLARYEAGTKLARQCQAKLEEAELKIQQLEKTAAGEFTLQPMAADDAA